MIIREELIKIIENGILHNYRPNAILQILLNYLPDDRRDIETQARNMQLQCISDNPTTDTVPSIYHYEQRLQHMDKSAEYYKQLLSMKNKG